VTVHLGPLASHQFASGSFDAIAMSHVIEHVHDPAGLLRECHRILRPGGLLSVVTPNWSSLGHRYFGRSWRGLEPPRHLQLYTLPTLVRELRQAGFVVETARTSVRIADFIWSWSR